MRPEILTGGHLDKQLVFCEALIYNGYKKRKYVSYEILFSRETLNIAVWKFYLPVRFSLNVYTYLLFSNKHLGMP